MSLGSSSFAGASLGSAPLYGPAAPQFAERTIFLGHDLLLFRPDPNWTTAVEIVHRLASDVESGRTGRENRRARHAWLRHELTASWLLEADAANEIETQLWTLGSAYFGIPLPVDMLDSARWSERIYEPEWVLNYDANGWIILAADSIPGSPTYALLAPLFVGRLASRPQLRALTSDKTEFSLHVLERAPWDFRLAPAAESVGADWPSALTVDWAAAVESATEDALELDDLGDTRIHAVDGQESAPRRRQTFSVTADSRAQIRALLQFFLARKGRVESFVVPWAFQPSPGDYAATPHATRVRFVADALRVRYLTDAVAEASIAVVQLPWEITPAAGETPVQAAVAWLYRLTASAPGPAAIWRFTSWESNLTRTGDGTYLGDVKGLFEHDRITQTIDLRDDPVALTSWIFEDNPLLRVIQRALDVPLRVEIFRCDPTAPDAAVLAYEGEIAEVVNTGRRLEAATSLLSGLLEVKVPAFHFSPICNHQFAGPGCDISLGDWLFGATIVSQTGLEVIVQEAALPAFTRACDMEAAKPHVGLSLPWPPDFTGIAVGVGVSGPNIPASAKIVAVHNDPAEPFFTLDKSPTATASDITLTFTPAAQTTFGAAAAGWFARGWIRKGWGLDHEIRQIVRSEPAGTGLQKLTLRRAFRAVTIGEAVTVAPSCTGTRAECQSKFNNYINFGGHPHIGPRNLSVPTRTLSTATGKK